MKSVITAFALLVCGAAPMVCQQPVDPATKEDVEQILELSGLRETMKSMYTAMAQFAATTAADVYRQKNPQATPAEVQKVALAASGSFQKATNTFSVDELIEVVIPVYQRYFTHSDLLALNDFYASPVGQKMLKNTPAMMADMMQALQPALKKRIDERLAQAEKAATATDQSGQTAHTGDTPTTANASMTGEAQRVRIDSGVSEGLLISQVPPVYPSLARQARIQGTVVLEAVIGKDGGIESLSVVSGHPMLIQAAMDAVKQWRYRPYLLNGSPVLVLTHINVNFTLQ